MTTTKGPLQSYFTDFSKRMERQGYAPLTEAEIEELIGLAKAGGNKAVDAWMQQRNSRTEEPINHIIHRALGLPTEEAKAENYIADLNAIQKAVLSHGEDFQAEFAAHLGRRFLSQALKWGHQLTAHDWCIAFVETVRGR